jgi:hypothetical protein
MFLNNKSNSMRINKNLAIGTRDKLFDYNNKISTSVLGPNIIRNNSKNKNSYNKIISINDSVQFPDPIKLTSSIYQGSNVRKSNSKPKNIPTSNNKFAINLNKNFNNFLKKTENNKILKNSVYSVVSDSSFSHRNPATTKNKNTSSFKNFSNRTNFNEINFLNSFDHHYDTESSVDDKNLINTNLKNKLTTVKERFPSKPKEKANNIRLYTKPQILVEDTISTDYVFENKIISPSNNQNLIFAKSINMMPMQSKSLNKNLNIKKMQNPTTSSENLNVNSTFSINKIINTKDTIFKQIKEKINRISNNRMFENKFVNTSKITNEFLKQPPKSRQVPIQSFQAAEPIPDEEDSMHLDSKLEESSKVSEDDHNESGVLTFDEVKDIIVYYDFKNFDVRERGIFGKNEYNRFMTYSKNKYQNILFPNKSETEIIMENNKSASTKDSSSTKKNFISVIKTEV